MMAKADEKKRSDAKEKHTQTHSASAKMIWDSVLGSE